MIIIILVRPVVTIIQVTQRFAFSFFLMIYLYKRNKLTFSFSTPSILMFDLTHVDRLSSIHQICMHVLQNIPEQVDVGVCMYVYLKLVRDILIF
jgi:hypothetical protein